MTEKAQITPSSLLSSADLEQIREYGLEEKCVLGQIEMFRRGLRSVALIKPCTPGDGILCLDDSQVENLAQQFQAVPDKEEVIKFVPASGAGTRMFQSLMFLNSAFQQIDQRMLTPDDPQMERNLSWFSSFIQDLRQLPFFSDLTQVLESRGIIMDELLSRGEYKEILRGILDPDGLNYGNLPKALMKFHSYPDECRTALEEHFHEAAAYARDSSGKVRLHLSVSAEYAEQVQRFMDKYRRRFASGGTHFEVRLSIQDPSTDTITMELEEELFRDDDGKLVFQPGGHGALLKNLNEIESDLIFIKNIDNIVHDRLKPLTTRYKKALGGLLKELRDQCYEYAELLSSCLSGGTAAKLPDQDKINEIEIFCSDKLNIRLSDGHLGPRERAEQLFGRLNRPLRVCGMVKKGEDAGGGPFWVNLPDGTPSIQIVESSELSQENETQLRIWEKSTHFNPVDMVCTIKDFKGRKFDLDSFVDPDRFFMSVRLRYGRPGRVMERPGLWNGAMALWNTVLVEVPRETFAPIKEVKDLLRPEHRDIGY